MSHLGVSGRCHKPLYTVAMSLAKTNKSRRSRLRTALFLFSHLFQHCFHWCHLRHPRVLVSLLDVLQIETWHRQELRGIGHLVTNCLACCGGCANSRAGIATHGL